MKINKAEGGEFYYTPQQVSVPMSAPLKFESDPDFADVRKLFDKIDECADDDLEKLEKLRLDVQARLDVIFNNDKSINSMISLV